MAGKPIFVAVLDIINFTVPPGVGPVAAGFAEFAGAFVAFASLSELSDASQPEMMTENSKQRATLRYNNLAIPDFFLI